MAFKLNPLTGRLDYYSSTNGFVKGPASATDRAIAIYDGTTGKLIQNSKATVQIGGAVVSNGFVINKILTEVLTVPADHAFITSGITIDTGGSLIVDTAGEVVIV